MEQPSGRIIIIGIRAFGRRFTAAWRREKVDDAARHRQEKREATRIGKFSSHTET